MFSLCENINRALFAIKIRIYFGRFDRTSPKLCFSNVKARRKGFLREGGASHSESNESIAGGNRTTNTSALRREQAAVSASLKPHSFPLSWRDKKGAPGGAQLKCGCGFVQNRPTTMIFVFQYISYRRDSAQLRWISPIRRSLISLPPEYRPRRSESWWAGRQRFWGSPGRRRRRGPARYRCRFPCRQ